MVCRPRDLRYRWSATTAFPPSPGWPTAGTLIPAPILARTTAINGLAGFPGVRPASADLRRSKQLPLVSPQWGSIPGADSSQLAASRGIGHDDAMDSNRRREKPSLPRAVHKAAVPCGAVRDCVRRVAGYFRPVKRGVDLKPHSATASSLLVTIDHRAGDLLYGRCWHRRHAGHEGRPGRRERLSTSNWYHCPSAGDRPAGIGQHRQTRAPATPIYPRPQVIEGYAARPTPIDGRVRAQHHPDDLIDAFPAKGDIRGAADRHPVRFSLAAMGATGKPVCSTSSSRSPTCCCSVSSIA